MRRAHCCLTVASTVLSLFLLSIFLAPETAVIVVDLAKGEEKLTMMLMKVVMMRMVIVTMLIIPNLFKS